MKPLPKTSWEIWTVCYQWQISWQQQQSTGILSGVQQMQLGEATVENITRNLPNWQLELTNLCGRAYDGANAGATKGAAAHILQQYSKALFTYCADHMLNLCVVKCSSVLKVSNATDLPDSIVCFFDNLPKRQNFWHRLFLKVKAEGH